MRRMLIPMAAALAIAFIPATSSAATVLTTSTPEYLGSVDPGSPSSPTDELAYINTLLSLSANSSTTIGGHTYTTSSNDCAGCPPALLTGNSGNIDTSGPVLNLDVTNWTYLLAKYADVSYVWNVANLTTVDIPATLNNGQGNGLSHYILFNPTTPTGVPDGGTTAGLLGLAMLGIGYLRRRML
jgi:protein with PEP-CTERM/exosortase system signal